MSTKNRKSSSAKRRKSAANQAPLSEDQRKYHPDWTADDCTNHLVAIAKEHPDQVITRNFFRVHSDIS